MKESRGEDPQRRGNATKEIEYGNEATNCGSSRAIGNVE
jgi:hypothetical protein